MTAAADRSLVDAVLDALLDASRWDEVLLEMIAMVGARAAILVTESWRDGQLEVAASVGLDATSLEAWRRRGLHHDVMIRSSLDLPAGAVIRDSDVMELGRFCRTEIATRLLAPSGLHHAAGGCLRLQDPGYAAVWFYRSQEDGPFPDQALPVLRQVNDRLRQALEINHRLMTARQQVLETRAALDQIMVAAIMVDGDGRPLGMNRCARKLIAVGDGIGARDDGLVGQTTSDTRALREAIFAAMAGVVGVRGVRLTRPSGRRDLEVIATALSEGTRRGRGWRAAGVVFVIDPEAQPVVPMDVLEDLYGLTPAEARLACLLPWRSGLAELAEELGVTRSTVQTQLAAVFRKTGTRRQADLIRLLVQGVAMVRSVEESSGFWFVRPAPGAGRDPATRGDRRSS